jgi:hypothetical protein
MLFPSTVVSSLDFLPGRFFIPEVKDIFDFAQWLLLLKLMSCDIFLLISFSILLAFGSEFAFRG